MFFKCWLENSGSWNPHILKLPSLKNTNLNSTRMMHPYGHLGIQSHPPWIWYIWADQNVLHTVSNIPGTLHCAESLESYPALESHWSSSSLWRNYWWVICRYLLFFPLQFPKEYKKNIFPPIFSTKKATTYDLNTGSLVLYLLTSVLDNEQEPSFILHSSKYWSQA